MLHHFEVLIRCGDHKGCVTDHVAPVTPARCELVLTWFHVPIAHLAGTPVVLGPVKQALFIAIQITFKMVIVFLISVCSRYNLYHVTITQLIGAVMPFEWIPSTFFRWC